MTELWKIFDLGRERHRPAKVFNHQRRFFIARNCDRPDEHHRHPYAIAARIVEWKNAWEDQLMVDRASGVAGKPACGADGA